MDKNHLLKGQDFPDMQIFNAKLKFKKSQNYRDIEFSISKNRSANDWLLIHYSQIVFNYNEVVTAPCLLSNPEKKGIKLNNLQNIAFRVLSTKTGSSETTTITAKDIISSNLSYSQSNFRAIFSSANLRYVVLTDRKDLSSIKFDPIRRLSKNSTVNVETDDELNIKRKALPVISQKSDY